MFGRNDFVENVKSALAAVDCDMGAFRSWQKMYDKLKKKKSEQEDRYRRCREQTKRVHAIGPIAVMSISLLKKAPTTCAAIIRYALILAGMKLTTSSSLAANLPKYIYLSFL